MSSSVNALHHHGLDNPDAVVVDRPRPKWPVLGVSALVTIVIAARGLGAPDHALRVLGRVVGLISDWFGWFYIALATAVLAFVIVMGIRHSRVRLAMTPTGPSSAPSPGPRCSSPQASAPT